MNIDQDHDQNMEISIMIKPDHDQFIYFLINHIEPRGGTLK
jgi:hypothetical protein